MLTVAATIGFLIVAACVSIFFLDFAMLNLDKKAIFGLPEMPAAKWLAGWLLAGIILMMVTFPDLISSYIKYTAESATRIDYTPQRGGPQK